MHTEYTWFGNNCKKNKCLTGSIHFSSGIIGLYTGYILAQQNKTKDITYIAEFLPGDQSSKYTSPWAGGNFSTVSGESEAELLYDKLSFTNLQKLAEKFGPKIGLAKMPATEYYVDEHEIPSEKKLKSMATYIPDVSLFFFSRMT